MKYTFTFTITLDEKHVSVVLSALYHILFIGLLLGLYYINDMFKMEMPFEPKQEEEIVKKEEPKIIKTIVRLRRPPPPAPAKPKSEKKKKAMTLEELLKNMNNQKLVKKKKVIKEDKFKQKDFSKSVKLAKNQNNYKYDAKASNFLLNDVNAKYDENAKYVDIDTSAMARLLEQAQSKFQRCYDKALFIDEFLSVNAKFIIYPSANPSSNKLDVTFKGPGTEKSKATFRNCLRQQIKTIKFIKSSFGRAFKYNVFFKS